MANVLNRTTRLYIESANTPDFPIVDWIHDPDLSQVTGFDSIYWIITGDIVTLMTPAQRAAVDAAILEANRDATVSNVDQVEDLIRAIILVLLDEINILRSVAIHPISSITRSGTTGTATTFVAHGLTTGDTITILGATLAAYNKTTTITVTGASTFTYSVTGSPTSPAAGSLYYIEGTPVVTHQRTLAQVRTSIRSRLGS
jgi:hypothetical protein